MNAFAWTVIGFLSGSIPYAVFVGRLAGAGDIRRYGDKNPGAANVGRALGWRWFILAMLLDCFKGAIPVAVAFWPGNITGWALIPVAIAPVLGHAFSPWLKMRGGKAVATTFGIWAGLSLGILPAVLGVLLSLTFGIVKVSGWAMMLAFILLGIIVAIFYAPAHLEFGVIWLANALVLTFKHRDDLRLAPGLRPWLWKRLNGS
jgi:acyl phosphate:glycerol-3-phosphate acyltransferase